MPEVIKPHHIIANLYHGPMDDREFRRGVNAVERWLSYPLDHILINAITNAAIDHRATEMTVLDIGSGDASLFTNLLEAPKAARLTREYLSQRRGFKVHLIGLTDSPSPEKHLQESPLRINGDNLTWLDEETNQQITARNFYYTLAAGQTLDAFLQAIGVSEIDLILATNSLRYFPRPVFKEVLETGVRYLRRGGRFMAYYFAGNLPWAFGGHNQGFNTEAARGTQNFDLIQVLNSHIENPLITPVAERELIAQDPRKYRALIKRAWSFYKRLDGLTADMISRKALTDEEIADSKRLIDRAFPAKDKPEDRIARLKMLAQVTLVPAYERFERKQRLDDLATKRTIVNGITGVDLRWTFPKQENGGGFEVKKI